MMQIYKRCGEEGMRRGCVSRFCGFTGLIRVRKRDEYEAKQTVGDGEWEWGQDEC